MLAGYITGPPSSSSFRCVHVCKCSCVCMCICACMLVSVCVCVCPSLCVWVCVCVLASAPVRVRWKAWVSAFLDIPVCPRDVFTHENCVCLWMSWFIPVITGWVCIKLEGCDQARWFTWNLLGSDPSASQRSHLYRWGAPPWAHFDHGLRKYLHNKKEKTAMPSWRKCCSLIWSLPLIIEKRVFADVQNKCRAVSFWQWSILPGLLKPNQAVEWPFACFLTILEKKVIMKEPF